MDEELTKSASRILHAIEQVFSGGDIKHPNYALLVGSDLDRVVYQALNDVRKSAAASLFAEEGVSA